METVGAELCRSVLEQHCRHLSTNNLTAFHLEDWFFLSLCPGLSLQSSPSSSPSDRHVNHRSRDKSSSGCSPFISYPHDSLGPRLCVSHSQHLNVKPHDLFVSPRLSDTRDGASQRATNRCRHLVPRTPQFRGTSSISHFPRLRQALSIFQPCSWPPWEYDTFNNAFFYFIGSKTCILPRSPTPYCRLWQQVLMLVLGRL